MSYGAILLGVSALSSVAAAAPEKAAPQSSTDATSKASENYRAGMDLFEAQKFEEALALFRQSYELVKSPNSHLMIARALAKLGKNAEAYEEITMAIPEADHAAEENEKYKRTASAMRAERDEMKSKVGFVVVNVKMEVSVGGRALSSDEIGRPVVAEPGQAEVVIKLPSGLLARQTVEVRPGDRTTVDLDAPSPPAPSAPAPPPAPPPPPRGIDPKTLGFVSLGVGVAGFAAFTAFGLLDDSKYDDLKSRCPGNVCPRTDSSEADTGRKYQALANVGLGVGIVGVVAGIVLFVAAPSRANAPASASLDVGPRSLAYRGSF